MQIFLVRHGVTEWNKKRVIQGQVDVPLAPEGRIQARETGLFLETLGLKKAFCSDLSRARETAEIISRPLGLKPKEITGLREINMGNWEGLSWEEVGERYPQERKAWLEDPLNNGPGGGENITQAATRFREAVLSISEPENNTGPVLIVSHGLVIGTLISWIRGHPVSRWREYSPDNATVSELERQKGGLHLVGFNKDI